MLTLLGQFGGSLDKISFQKLLFLFTRHQEKKSFYFVPYKFGCYSFQANADLKTLSKYKQTINTEEYWELIDNRDYFSELNSKDRAAIRYVKSEYGKYNCRELVKITYKKYPYFAVNSLIAEKYLSPDEYKKVKAQRPVRKETTLFTIGYEGISLEEYINKLIINDVRVLCDVRKNPNSMKFGFSKNQLRHACKGADIEYVHVPEVGIENDKRRALNSQSDYDKLFKYYKKFVLPEVQNKQAEVLDLLREHKRIALTCFEANVNQCHRKHLAESISDMDGFKYNLKHI